MSVRLRKLSAIFAIIFWTSIHAVAGEAAPAGPSPSELMKRGLYQDAARALLAEIRNADEAACGQKFLMLGECYYLVKDYAKARPYYAKADANLADGANQLIAEYRLACVAYRMGDTIGAAERIGAFVARHPADHHTDTLLLFKMKMLAAKGKDAEAPLEAIHKQILENRKAYSDAVAVAADKLLTDFYVEHGQEEKATQRYASTVHNFRNVIAQYAKDKRPVPAGLEQAHDHAAMQLGAIGLKAKKYDDAARWLENVKYDPELKREARLLLAQVAYQKRDFDSIELGLLEAMLKSDKEDLREKARARFAELANEYGTDVRFQKLAMDLAEWYRAQGQFAAAAREYKGIADRGANLSQEDRLKALFMAGKLYSKAAYESRNAPVSEARYGIYIHPKEVFKLADILKTYRPLQQKIRVKWPENAREITGEDAITLVSEASGVPFIWASDHEQHAVNTYLKTKKLRFESLNDTAEGFLKQILDLEHHRLDFDIGITGGVPTLTPKPPDADDPEQAERVRTIELYDQRRWFQRYKPLARDYGSWRSAHGKRAMLFNVVQRIEELSGTKVLWAEGVDKDAALAAEYEAVPGIDPGRNLSCAETLAGLLAPLDLRLRIVPRDLSAELYEEAKGCFNQIRQIDPRSPYGEKSLFLVALNFYHQEDYERMKIVLREYLKLFDSPGHEHYHEACFWVGWVFEREKHYRDACRYYGRAAEEGLALYKPAADEKRPTREELKAILSYDTRFALEEPVNGAFKDCSLEKDFVDFIRLNANVTVRLDASAVGIEAPLNRDAFKQVPVFGVLCDALDHWGLSFRVENVSKADAERAYYRMASAYKKDGLMEQALASINALLTRFPATSRKRDAYKLKLDVYKGLKDYRSVLATLEQFKTELKGEIEPYQIDFELAWIYFDLCRYGDAVEHFRKSLAAAKDPRERLNIRDGEQFREQFRGHHTHLSRHSAWEGKMTSGDMIRHYVGLVAIADSGGAALDTRMSRR